jgi:hypothetical protein
MGKQILALVVAMAAGCGGQGGLSGDLSVAINWHGDWSAADQRSLTGYVEGLAPAGYFARMPRGLAPRFHVVDESAPHQITIELWKHGTTGPTDTRMGYHEGDASSGALVITICPEAAYDWSTAAYVLAHELVETASDPWCEDNDEEIADPCAFEGFAQLLVDGAQRRVPKYLTAEGCWPVQ